MKPHRRTVREAKRFLKETDRLIKKNAKKVSATSRQRVEEAMKDVEDALEGKRGEKRLSTSIKALDTIVDEVLGFARKSSIREFVDSIVVAVLIAALLRAFVVEAFKIPSGSMIPTLEVGDHIFVNKFTYGLRVPFTNAWFVEWGEPQRGEVVVFRYPLDTSKDYIKRIVAVAGDTVRVRGRDVTINNKLLERGDRRVYDYFEDAEFGAAAPFPIERHAHAFPERSQGDDPHNYTVLYERREFERLPLPNGAELPGLDCVYDQPGRPPECKVKDDYVFVMGDNRDNSSDGRVWGGVPRSYIIGEAMFVWLSWGQRAKLRLSRIGKTVE